MTTAQAPINQRQVEVAARSAELRQEIYSAFFVEDSLTQEDAEFLKGLIDSHTVNIEDVR